MLLNTLVVCLFFVFILNTSFFLVALITKNNSVADIAWGLGFILIAIVSLALHGYESLRQAIVTCLVSLWGTRLASYIYLRNLNKKEDFRYKKWREKWGKDWILKSYLYVFITQGLLMLLISLPVSYTNTHLGPQLGLLDLIGVLVWTTGFFFETVGDWQLLKFKLNNKNHGKILTSGLWRYTRHPNYFGEATMWWGIYIIALSNSSAWWTFIGPLFITFSLLKVSGIIMLEKKYKGNKDYQEYKRTTSSFIPWFPHNKLPRS